MEDSMTPVGKKEAFGPWTAHIEAMDEALAANDTDECIRAWRLAYSAALSHPGWLGLFTVATALRRVGTSASLARSAAALIRETYWIAFYRARQQRSLNGVLATAEAFAMLGDHDSAERCSRVSKALESSAGDTSAADHVRLHAHGVGRLQGSRVDPGVTGGVDDPDRTGGVKDSGGTDQVPAQRTLSHEAASSARLKMPAAKASETAR